MLETRIAHRRAVGWYASHIAWGLPGRQSIPRAWKRCSTRHLLVGEAILRLVLRLVGVGVTPRSVEIGRLVKGGRRSLDSISYERLRQPRTAVGADLITHAIRVAALSTDHLTHPQGPRGAALLSDRSTDTRNS